MSAILKKRPMGSKEFWEQQDVNWGFTEIGQAFWTPHGTARQCSSAHQCSSTVVWTLSPEWQDVGGKDSKIAPLLCLSPFAGTFRTAVFKTKAMTFVTGRVGRNTSQLAWNKLLLPSINSSLSFSKVSGYWVINYIITVVGFLFKAFLKGWRGRQRRREQRLTWNPAGWPEQA